MIRPSLPLVLLVRGIGAVLIALGASWFALVVLLTGASGIASSPGTVGIISAIVAVLAMAAGVALMATWRRQSKLRIGLESIAAALFGIAIMALIALRSVDLGLVIAAVTISGAVVAAGASLALWLGRRSSVARSGSTSGVVPRDGDDSNQSRAVDQTV